MVMVRVRAGVRVRVRWQQLSVPKVAPLCEMRRATVSPTESAEMSLCASRPKPRAGSGACCPSRPG